MRKDVFNEIIQDNMNSTLVSVTLSGGLKLGQALEIEGNRTTRTTISFAKLEETYVAIRKHIDVSYDYNGQVRKGDSRNADFYLGYEEIVAIEFFDAFLQQVEQEARKSAEKERQKAREVERKKADAAKAEKKKAKGNDLFLETAGDI